MTTASTDARCCIGCAHLVDDGATLESTFPALLILSSAHGESRGDQGLCRLHDTLVTPELTCDSFLARPRG
jgi:hypothetical protein